MDKSNDNINKIDEQIQSLMYAENMLYDKDNENKNNLQNDNYVDSDTKTIDNIEALNYEEVKEEEVTKDLPTISDIPAVSAEEEKKNDVEVLTESPIETKNNKKNNRIIIVIIIMFVILVGIIFLCIFLKKEKVSKEVEKTYTKRELKEIMIEYGDALKGAISMYLEKDQILLEYDTAVKLIHNEYHVECNEHEIYDDGLIYLNQCFIDDIEIPYSYGEKQEKKVEFVPDGNSVKVYVSNIDLSATLIEPSSKDDYTEYSVVIDGDFSNLDLLDEKESYLIYSDENKNFQMVNFITGRKVLDFLNYTSVLPIRIGNHFDTHYIAVLMDQKWGIYEFTRNERIVYHIYDSITPYVGISSDHSSIPAIADGIIAVSDSGLVGVINYRTGESILPLDYSSIRISGNYLWTNNSTGKGRIFDFSGNELLADQYDILYRLEDGQYVLVLDGEDVKLITIQGEELYNYGKLELGLFTYSTPYKNGALFGFINNGSDGGCLEIIYDGFSKEGKVESVMCGNIAKPVLYLYPKKKTIVTVSFDRPELLETTYPKYNNKWVVEAYPNGSLYDSNHKYYYGLYWDEKKEYSVDFSSGFYVEKDNAIEFLEEKLRIIGLSYREANEFIMYWLPILEKNEKSLVYFELTNERESNNRIIINPKPDSLLRVVIHVKRVNQIVSIPEEKLEHFKRDGFVAVEWGGTVY